MKQMMHLVKTRLFDMRYVEIKSSNSKNTISNHNYQIGNNFLRGMYFNATSLENKIDELRLLCKTENPHIIVINIKISLMHYYFTFLLVY